MDFEDKLIVCQDCGKEFPHTAEDQKRYAERGFTADPKRCRECRQARKEKAAAGEGQGGPRRRPGGGGSRGSQGHGGPRGSGFPQPRERGQQGPHQGGRGRAPRQSYDAICAACGTPTTVPFEPKPGREVFCRDCYTKLRDG